VGEFKLNKAVYNYSILKKIPLPAL